MPAQRRFPFTAQVALSTSFADLLGGAPDREPPKEFRVFTRDVNHSTKGDFLFDAQAAEVVLSAFRQHGIDLVIDYDHAALAAPMVKVEAAGWIKGLEVRDGELWATGVTWTSGGEKHLRAGEYRYISPTFDWDEKSGRIGKLITVSLLNTPALHGLDALVAAGATTTEGEAMDPELKKALERNAELEKENATLKAAASTGEVQLSVLVGLGATASMDAVRTTITALTQLQGRVLQLTGQASIPAALGVVEGWKSEAADAARLKGEKEQVEQEGYRKEIASLLDKASTDGKIPPAHRPSWEKDAVSLFGGKPSKEGVAWLTARIDTLVAVPGHGGGTGAAGGGQGGGQPHRQPGGTAALSSADQKLARIMNLNQNDLLDWDNKRQAGGGT